MGTPRLIPIDLILFIVHVLGISCFKCFLDFQILKNLSEETLKFYFGLWLYVYITFRIFMAKFHIWELYQNRFPFERSILVLYVSWQFSICIINIAKHDSSFVRHSFSYVYLVYISRVTEWSRLYIKLDNTRRNMYNNCNCIGTYCFHFDFKR